MDHASYKYAEASGPIAIDAADRLAAAHRADVLIGAICGALLAAAVIGDVVVLIVERFLG